MDLYEEQAKEKEFHARALREVTLKGLEDGKINQNILDYVLRETFRLGHNAGHCRGERHVKNTYNLSDN